MNNTSKEKMRTVTISQRGQLVVPEDIRKDLGIKGEETLILIEKGNEIVIKKESNVLKAIKEDDTFWEALSKESMKRAWSKEDEIWDSIAKGK